jgi:serine/threonine-protein kinase RsbW
MSEQFVLRIAAKIECMPTVHRFVKETAAALGLDPSVIHDVRLAVEEMFSNTVLHGYRGEEGDIEIEISQEEGNLVIYLRDQAPPFDPTCVPPPDLTRPLKERPIGGAGIYLACQVVDDISHRITGSGGNEVTLTKRAVIGDHPAP